MCKQSENTADGRKEGREAKEERKRGHTEQQDVKCQHGNVRGAAVCLTTLIQHQVILVAELLRSTRHKNVLIAKEVLQTRHLGAKTRR